VQYIISEPTDEAHVPLKKAVILISYTTQIFNPHCGACYIRELEGILHLYDEFPWDDSN
jgi:hypothetical protein